MDNCEIILILICLLGIKNSHSTDHHNPVTLNPEDVDIRMPELVSKYGYPIETHEVETEDGYLLTMFRIPNTTHKNHSLVKTPVLLMHGFICSSDTFVDTGPQRALAYLLADQGYDVWIGNSRGNKYSRKHKTIDPSQKLFWYFSWHELGTYDLPAMIDHVLKTTSSPSLYYIGHSQGTTIFYVMASERPEYNKKIKLHISLAPIVFMSHSKTPYLRIMAAIGDIFKDDVEKFATFEFMRFLPHSALVKLLLTKQTMKLWSSVIFLFTGFDPDQLNMKLYTLILSHMPAGGSFRQVVHYVQLFISGKFQQYDFGKKNIDVYSMKEPPNYNLTNVTAPVALMYGDNDWLADLLDLKKLIEKLPNIVMKYKVPYPKFNHVDFLYGVDVRDFLYNEILELLRKY